MDFSVDDRELDIRSAVRRLASDFSDEYWQECDEGAEFPWEFYDAIAKAGWLAISFPKQYGGGGLGVSEAGLVLEEIAASGAAMNGCSAIHLTMFGMNVITKHGSEALREQFLPAVCRGEIHSCFAITEPDAGTDTTNISTFAAKVTGGYSLRGRKIWITKAGDSDVMLVLARTTALEDCDRPTDGMTLFLADMDDDAVEVRPIKKLGRNAIASNEVFIDDLFVPDERVVGDEGRGFWHLLDGINPERILVAHEAIGIGRVSLDKAVAYAKERVVFGRPVGQNQGIQFPLAEALARLDAAELVVRKAAWLYDRGESCGREANIGKYLAAEAAFFAADRAVQTLGGLGYAREYNVERYFREARLMKIAPVTQEMALNYIGNKVLGLPKSY